MTDRPPLNPLKTPRCPVYDKMNNRLHNLMRLNAKYDPANMISEMMEHRMTCPICRARMDEIEAE